MSEGLTLAGLADDAERISDIYAARCHVARDGDWHLLKLQEELGELVQAHLKLDGRARLKSGEDWRANREDEAADLLCQLLLYCRAHGIDLEAAIQRKWLAWLDADAA